MIPYGDYSSTAEKRGKLFFLPENAKPPKTMEYARKTIIHLLVPNENGKYPILGNSNKQGPACNPRVLVDTTTEQLTDEVRAVTCYHCLKTVLSNEELSELEGSYK